MVYKQRRRGSEGGQHGQNMLAEWAEHPEGKRPRTVRPRSDSLWNEPVVDVLQEHVKSSAEVKISGGTLKDALKKLQELWDKGEIDHICGDPVPPQMPGVYHFYTPEHHVMDYKSVSSRIKEMGSVWAKCSKNRAAVFIDIVRFPEDDHDLRVGKIVSNMLPDDAIDAMLKGMGDIGDMPRGVDDMLKRMLPPARGGGRKRKKD